MTLQQFLEKWNGQFCEITGSANAKNQCVDLANAYLRDVCNHPIVEWTNAVDFPSKIKDMEWIPNDEETDLPKEGDIIIWNSNVGGGSGHIAIFLDGTTSKFNSFDQNWPLYSPCHVQSHTYTNVSGWLKPIINSDETMTDEQKRILDFIGTRTEGDVREAFGALADQPNKDEQIRILQNSIKTLEAQLEAVNAKVAELEAKFVENQKNLDSCQSKLTTANSKIDKLNETISNITEEKNTWQTRYNNKNTEFNDVTEKFDNLSKLFEEYKKHYPQTTKPSIIEFIKSLFLKWKK
jgi:hypothetical protein